MASLPDQLESIISVPPNQSCLLLDSRYRGKEDYPGNFKSYLSAGIVAKELEYVNLQWTTPLFTHTVLNNEIRYQVEGDDRGDVVYVSYALPWVTFKLFDGNDVGGGFKPPQPGSYAKDIEVAFNTDVRLLTSNFVALDNPAIYVDGLPITWFFQFNQSQGFVLFCKDSENNSIAFRIDDCSWITEGYNVHGFGVLDPTLKLMRPKYYDDPTVFYEGYVSDATPSLTLSKFLTVYSEQLTRERRLPSFRNITDSTLQEGNENFNNELAVLPILLSNVGRYTSNTALGDATRVSIRTGSEAQYLHIYMIDNASRFFVAGNPMGNFLNDPTVPAGAKEAYLSAAGNYRSPAMMNYLLFGQNTEQVMNITALFDRKWTYPMVGTSPLAYSSFNNVYRTPGNSAATDTRSAWQRDNTYTITKKNTYPSSWDITSEWILTASNVVTAFQVRPFLGVWKYARGVQPLYISDFEFVVRASSPLLISATPADIGTITSVSYTVPQDLLNPLIEGVSYQIYELFEADGSWSLGDYSVSFENSLNPGPDPDNRLTVNTTVASIYDEKYIPPYYFDKYADPKTICLNDELIHQFTAYF